MSDLGGIEMCYLEGKEEKKKKNYLCAARLFRMCHHYYEYGELPMYYPHLESYGIDAEWQYEVCKSKLTDDAQRMLENEEHELYGNWREFVRYDGEKIREESNSPSPNRPKKKPWWSRWIGIIRNR